MQTVRDAMTRSVISVRPETPLREVARLFVDERISGVPVVDRGAVLGVVSEADFLIKEQGAEGAPHRPLARFLGESAETRQWLGKFEAVTAGDAMTSPATTIEPDRPISEAAELMTGRAINRLPVVDDGRLVGIVTRADLVRAYARSDEELARTIREDVILGILWLDPALFSVEVKDGLATIGGRAELRSTAEMLERAARMVPGIVDVRFDVSWAVNDRDPQAVSSNPYARQ